MNGLYFLACDGQSVPRPDQAAGRISFSGQEISLVKTADGASLRLGCTIELSRGLHVSMSGFTGEIGFVGRHSKIALGVGVDPECHVVRTGATIKTKLWLPLSLAALETVERLRDGGPPEFTIVLRGSVFVLDEQPERWHARRLLALVDGSADIRVRADRDRWIQEVRGVSPMGSVLIEIPLAVGRASPWDQVWERLESASANLLQGGELGCKSCVSEVRQALELWRKIDEFQLGGSNRSKDKKQRIHDVANALSHYCSLSVHADEHTSSWTRADAILALAGLCALLSARDP